METLATFLSLGDARDYIARNKLTDAVIWFTFLGSFEVLNPVWEN